MSLTVNWNDNPLVPAPLISLIDRRQIRTSQGDIIGCEYSIQLEGYIVEKTGGASNVFEAQAALLELFKCDGILLIECNGNVLLEACAQVLSVEFPKSPDNMVWTQPYSINLTTRTLTNNDCCYVSQISQFDETWSIDPDLSNYNYFSIPGINSPRKLFNVTHRVSASAMNGCQNSGDLQGWEAAREFVLNYLQNDTGIFDASLLGAGCITGVDLCNHARVASIDTSNGSFSIEETWILSENTGDNYHIKESFDITCSTEAGSRLKTVNISGSIEGFELASYSTGDCREISKSKWDSALEYWEVISGQIYDRAQILSDWSLSPIPTSSSVVKSIYAGTINYQFGYDNNLNCIVPTGDCVILSESINVDTSYPADVYAELQILGRPCPLLQCLGIRTKGTKNISINLVVDCGDPCSNFNSPGIKPEVDAFIHEFYAQLTGTYIRVYKDSDTESWNPKTGTYAKSVSYSYEDCCL